MSLIAWLVLGALAGWIASIIASTNEQQGAIGNIVVGILGAFVGGFIMSLIGETGITGFDLYSALVAILGAFVLLTIYKMFSRKV